MSGSGVWRGGETLAYNYDASEAADTLGYADVTTWGEESTAKHVAPLRPPEVSPLGPDKSWSFNDLVEDSEVVSATGTVTCKSKLVVGGDGYVVAALEGIDADSPESPSMQWGARACAVLPCGGGGGNECLEYTAGAGLESVELEFAGLVIDGARLGLVAEVVGYEIGAPEKQILVDYELDEHVLRVIGKEGIRITSVVAYQRDFSVDSDAVYEEEVEEEVVVEEDVEEEVIDDVLIEGEEEESGEDSEEEYDALDIHSAANKLSIW